MLRRWYGVAVGGLGWTPKVFWKATIAEFVMAVDGHNDTQTPAKPAMSRTEFEELEARYTTDG